MGDLKNILVQKLKDCPRELLETVEQVVEIRELEAIEHYRVISIIHGSDALLEAKLPDEKIMQLLQRHYDLRRSEAEKALQQAKNRAAK